MTVRRYSPSPATREARGVYGGRAKNPTIRVMVTVEQFDALKRVADYHHISLSAAARDYVSAGLLQDRKIIERST
jgi:hypothetical protein